MGMVMRNIDEVLFEAIRAKCQHERWFGADLDDSQWRINPDVDFFDEPENQFVRVEDHPQCFGFEFPPATEEQVQTTEAQLGFPLPSLLKALYTHIANGGFGPGAGLRGIAGGYGSIESGTHAGDTETVMDQYKWRSHKRAFDLAEYGKQEQGNEKPINLLIPYGEWYRALLPICHLGCVQQACVDSQERMFVTAPVESNDVYWLSQLPWTLEEWLWRWVKGEELLERYPPGSA